jgi:hypothetical protein
MNELWAHEVPGSCDSGSTVHADDEILNEKIAEACRHLNLRGHIVGRPPNGQYLYTPVTPSVVLGSNVIGGFGRVSTT